MHNNRFEPHVRSFIEQTRDENLRDMQAMLDAMEQEAKFAATSRKNALVVDKS